MIRFECDNCCDTGEVLIPPVHSYGRTMICKTWCHCEAGKMLQRRREEAGIQPRIKETARRLWNACFPRGGR